MLCLSLVEVEAQGGMLLLSQVGGWLGEAVKIRARLGVEVEAELVNF